MHCYLSNKGLWTVMVVVEIEKAGRYKVSSGRDWETGKKTVS